MADHTENCFGSAKDPRQRGLITRRSSPKVCPLRCWRCCAPAIMRPSPNLWLQVITHSYIIRRSLASHTGNHGGGSSDLFYIRHILQVCSHHNPFALIITPLTDLNIKVLNFQICLAPLYQGALAATPFNLTVHIYHFWFQIRTLFIF